MDKVIGEIGRRAVCSSIKKMLTSRLQEELLSWFDAHGRDLPWRRTNDPYAIWVSEVMLQQTQAATVIPYFSRWMARYRTVEDLAGAEEQEALAIWQGLGYYRRCRNLLDGARHIAANGMPGTRKEWELVPGVGAYTSAAIASIALGEPVGLVDGNVERVFARLTGCGDPGRALHRAAWKWAEAHVRKDRPGDWNQALMELGAVCCTPKDPECDACPLAEACVARQSWAVALYPARSAGPKTVRISQLAWVPFCAGRFGVKQIPAGCWSEGMWEFPNLLREAESSSGPGEDQGLRSLVGEGWLESLGNFSYSVTHHRIRMDVWLVRVDAESESLVWKTFEELAELPMPSAQRRALRLARSALGG